MKLYFFRGKAATGKTLISNALSKQLNISVLRKDDIFDSISLHISDNILNNNITYDLLAKQIQTNIDNGTDIIVDVGLANINSLSVFLNKIDFKSANVCKYYCECLDNKIWISRLQERLLNPLPNQFFTSVEELTEHYNNEYVKALSDETIIDSTQALSKIINTILLDRK